MIINDWKSSNFRTAVEVARRSGKKIVFTNGVFDLFHVGHLRLLNEAKCSITDAFLIVAVNTTASVAKVKRVPYDPLSDRLSLVNGIHGVDLVTELRQKTPHDLIVDLSPDVIVKGSDYQVSQIVGAEHMRNIGGKVIVVPRIKKRSTTERLATIKKRLITNKPQKSTDC